LRTQKQGRAARNNGWIVDEIRFKCKTTGKTAFSEGALAETASSV
jgi:hypothetical protein